MDHTLLPLVEGQSEVAGLPILLRRLLALLDHPSVQVARPFRIHRTKIKQDGEIERAIVQGLRSRKAVTGIVVVVDADDDDPAEIEELLRSQCGRATHLPVAVAAATRELEGWFLGAKESLRGFRSIRGDAKNPEYPETIRGAKERLSKNMKDGRTYIEVDDQPAFAEKLDLQMALERCPSLQRLARSLQDLLAGG